ncbi:MAG: hypothetical protein WBA31_10450 [Candidatus Dormiibacterota bacterium]
MKRALAATVVAVALGAILWGPAGRLLNKLANTMVRSERARPAANASPTEVPPEAR